MTQVTIESGTTWTVPSGVTTLDKLEGLGGGGTGGSGAVAVNGGGGGAGGGYAQNTSGFTVTPSAVIDIRIGGIAGDTWFNKAANSAPASATNGILCKGGPSGSGTTSGVAPSTNIGNTVFKGGDGGAQTANTGGGGGGSGGPDGAGNSGSNATRGTADAGNATRATKFDATHGCGDGGNGGSSAVGTTGLLYGGGGGGGGPSNNVGGAGRFGLLVINYTAAADAPEVAQIQFTRNGLASDFSTALQSQLLGSYPNLLAPVDIPFDQLDWPVPQGPRRRPQDWTRGFRIQDIQFPPITINYNWPVPVGPTYAISLRTWVDQTKINLIGQDRFFGLAGSPNFDWPVPKGPRRGPQDWAQGFRIQDQAALFPPITINYNWPVPTRPGYAISLRTWIDPTRTHLIGKDQLPSRQTEWPNPRGPVLQPVTWTNLALAISVVIQPFRQTEWPNPRGALRKTSVETWIDRTRINLIGQDQFFGVAGNPNRDWPVPKGPSRNPQDWTQGFRVQDQAALFPSITNQHDWPVPRGPIYPVSLRTWSDQTRRQLIGQDQLPGRQTEWPVPRNVPRASTLITWVDQTKINLIGKDQFFGLAGHPNFDWPVPKTAKGSIALYTWTQPVTQPAVTIDERFYITTIG